MFSLTFADVKSGWMDVVLRDGDQHGEASASYLTDGPGDLLRAVVAPTKGAGSSRCIWVGEPEEYLWSFTRKDAQVSLELLWFRDEAGRLPLEEGRPVFSTTCALAELVAALRSQFEVLRTRYGADGYRRRWRHPFPDGELAALGPLAY